MEYSNCCRICLSASSNLFGIFDSSAEAMLSEKIMYCASVEITANDRLPKYICFTCKDSLDIAFQFKTNCEESSKKLQSIIDLESINILRNLHKSDEDKIRSEVVFFDDSALLYEETVSSNIETEIEMVHNNYEDTIPSPEKTECPENALPFTEEHELQVGEDDIIKNKDEKVVVIQMNANILADISKSVTEKLSKSPVGRHTAKKNSSQVPRKIKRCSEHQLVTEKKQLKQKTVISPVSHQINSSNNISEESSEESDHQFTCTICNKYYETNKQLMRHIRTHSTTKLHVCKVCHKSFKNKYNLSVHSLKHSGRFPYKCRICKKGFANMSVLKRHSISHDGKTPYKCKYCKKEFPYDYSLRVHEAIHVDRPKYTCGICFKIFSYTNSLSAHLKTHKGDKPHACKMCPSVFTRNTSLRRHMIQNHEDNRLFSCKICEQSFETKDGCKTHETDIHLKIKCEFCSRRFSNKSLLIKHLKIHKSFPCKLCNKKYKSNNALLLHYKLIHVNKE